MRSTVCRRANPWIQGIAIGGCRSSRILCCCWTTPRAASGKASSSSAPRTASKPSILRPGRLERAIEIAAPDADGVLNILRFHVRDDLPDDQLRTVASFLDGFTAAEIMEAVRRARRKARVARRILSFDDLKDAALPMPTEQPEALWRIAAHEAGHVVVAHAYRLGTIKSARLGGRNGAGGITSIDLEAVDLATRHSIERQVVGIL